MKVAVAQLKLASCDLDANLCTTERAIVSACERGAQLIVLPELATTGYLLDRQRLGALAEPATGTGPALSRWRQIARRGRVAIIGGFAEDDGGRLYNSAAAIDQRGKVVACYRKQNLFGQERRVFDRAEPLFPIVELAGARVGLAICYDLRFPEVLRILMLRGAQMVAVPTAWVRGFDRAAPPGPEGSIWQVTGALVQANLNRFAIACADQVGEIGENEFLGRSLIASSYGEVLAGPLGAAEEAVEVADVFLGEPVIASSGIDPRVDARADVFAALMTASREVPHPDQTPLPMRDTRRGEEGVLRPPGASFRPGTDLGVNWNVQPAELPAPVAATLKARGAAQVNLYRALANSPEIVQLWLDFIWSLRDNCTAPRSLRELAILRTAARHSSSYEWVHHAEMARRSGIPAMQIEAIADGIDDHSIFDPSERLVFDLTDAICDGAVPPELAARAVSHFGARVYVEIAVTAATYVMVPRVLDALGVPLEDRKTSQRRD